MFSTGLNQAGIKQLNLKLELLSQYFYHRRPDIIGKDTTDFKSKRAKAKPGTGSDWGTNVLRMELENKIEEAGRSTEIACLQRPGLGAERNLRLELTREVVRELKLSEDSTEIK